jgi:hypothetical protein
MQRVLFGLLKGLMIGGGAGYLLHYLDWTSSVPAYLGCALVGALVGLICGRLPWKSETIWTPVVKMIVGSLVGAGLCALGLKFLPEAKLPLHIVPGRELVTNTAPVLAVLVGALYGVFVEVDDGGSRAENDKPAKAPQRKKGSERSLPEA